MNWKLLWGQKNNILLWTVVDHFQQGILGWVLGDHSAATFRPLWKIVGVREVLFLCHGWLVSLSWFYSRRGSHREPDLYDTG